MFPALIRAAGAGLSRVKNAVLGSSPKPTATPARTAVRVSRPAARIVPTEKPNKFINPRKPGWTPPPQAPRGGVSPRARIEVPGHTGTTDRTYAGEHTRVTGKDPTPRPAGPGPGQQGQTWDSKAANLAFAASSLNQLASSFIPGITWAGAVSARGFKTTPIRDVLHYCLAVVFGLAKQSRIGNVLLKADLFHVENRVEVHYQSTTVMALEALNTVGTLVDKVANGVTAAGARIMGGKTIVEGVANFIIGDSNPVMAVKQFTEAVDDLGRLLGPAGIWEMGQTDIRTGIPPGSMLAHITNNKQNEKSQPFQTMFEWSWVHDRPLLTRDLALNPEPTPMPQMDVTHYDLRSLVAQIMHDPGVLPPVPDTNIALASKELP